MNRLHNRIEPLPALFWVSALYSRMYCNRWPIYCTSIFCLILTHLGLLFILALYSRIYYNRWPIYLHLCLILTHLGLLFILSLYSCIYCNRWPIYLNFLLDSNPSGPVIHMLKLFRICIVSNSRRSSHVFGRISVTSSHKGSWVWFPLGPPPTKHKYV